jgi:opacity protein-like surface antigen
LHLSSLKEFFMTFKTLLCVLLTTALATAASADGWIVGGRTQNQSRVLEIYAGIGDMGSLEGRVQETANGGVVSGGLDTSLLDLNIDSGSEVFILGGKITGRWFSVLVDYRQSSISGSGTADSEIRLNVDQVSFAGQSLEYLLIPVGSDYDVSADTTWLGVGLRFNAFTLNPTGQVRFTPWLHLGAQYIASDFSIDAGSTLRIEIPGFDSRAYAVNGNASGEAQLLVPEYGFGGEVRWLLGEEAASPAELSFFATYKILNYDGALSSIGVDAEEFENLTVDYTSIELGANFYYPLSESIDLLVGLYYEQVDSNTVLASKPSSIDYQREVDLNYSLYGLRAGLRF